jgi:hypothetical protein
MHTAAEFIMDSEFALRKLQCKSRVQYVEVCLCYDPDDADDAARMMG